MVTAEVEINNTLGMHLRPAALFCEIAQRYPCRVTIQIREKTVNAKSVLSLLAAGIKKGEVISISCDGQEEEEALHALCELVENGLSKTQDGE